MRNLFQTLRLAIFGGLSYLSFQYFQASEHALPLGLLGGASLYLVLKTLQVKAVEAIYRSKKMRAFDTLFMADRPDNLTNVVAAFFIEKFDFEEMKAHLLTKARQVPACQTKVVEVLGEYYRQPLTEDEYRALANEIVILADHIRTERELQDFMAQIQTVRLPEKSVSYQFYLVPNMDGDKGAIVFKVHHSLGDGLALSSFFLAMTDNYQASALPGLKPLSWTNKLLIYAALPYYFFRQIAHLVFPPTDKNAISNGRPLSGKKNGAFERIDFAKFKAATKRLGCTVNDLANALICKSLYDYFQIAKKDPDFASFDIPTSIQFNTAISLRQPVERLEDLQMTNELSQMTTRLPISPDFAYTVAQTKESFKDAKNIMAIFATNFACRVLLQLPFGIPRFLIEFVTNKNSAVVSNIFASKVPFNFLGKAYKGHFYYAITPGKTGCGILILKIGDEMSISCFADEARMKDPEVFIEQFRANYKEYVLA